MEELWNRLVGNMFGRLDGPLHLRILVQPLVAIIFATLDGLKDARAGKPAYGWAVFTNPEHRRELLKDGWKHFGKIFILAIVLDVVYQLKVHHTVYPGETILVALVLAVLPYVLLRGPVNRVARLFRN
jgi:hypothetical protein